MFADRLRDARKAKRYSQTEVSRMLGVTQQAVGKWETGRSTPDPQTVARLAEILDTTADALLGLQQAPTAAPAVGRNAFSRYTESLVPVVGTVRAGYGALAFEEDYGKEYASVKDPQNYFYLVVKGDSMEPRISDGDLALVHRQSTLENGDLGVLVYGSDGEGTLLVTEACLLSAGRNPQLTKDEIAAALCRMLGAKKVLWLPRGIDGDETNEHIDNVCAFVRPGEVVLAWTDDPTDPQYACSQACLHYLEGETDAQGRRIRVHKLPIPRVPVLVTQEDLEGYTFEDGEDVREVGERLAASYVNYYCANGAIVLPAFGGENAASDAQAAAILAGLYPERRIISVYAREILTGGGNIHCITQQIPEGAKL